MLQLMRSKKFAKRVLWCIAAIIIPAFVLWGSGSLTKGPAPIGTIDGAKIHPSDMADSIKGVQVELLLTYYNNYKLYTSVVRNHPLLKKLAWDRLVMLRAARKNKISASDNEVLSYIQNHPAFMQNETFNEKTYNYIVTNVLGLEPRDFEEILRTNLSVNKFQDSIYKNVSIDDAQIISYFEKLTSNIDISFIVLTSAFLDEIPYASEEEIKSYYEQNQDNLTSEEKIQIEFLSMPYTSSEEKITAIEELENIRARINDGAALDKEAKDTIEYMKTQLVKPKDLLGKMSYSPDVYNTIVNLTKGALSPVMANGDEKEGSAILIRNVDKVYPEPLTFDQAYNKIKLLLDRSKLNNSISIKAIEIYKDLSAKKYALEKFAESSEFLLVFAKQDVSSEDYVETLGPANRLFQYISSLEEGEYFPPVKGPKGISLIRLDEINPSDKEISEKEKEMIKMRLTATAKQKALDEWFDDKAPKAELSEAKQP